MVKSGYSGCDGPSSLVLELCPDNVGTVLLWLPPAWVTLWTQLSTWTMQGPGVQGFNLTQ